MAKKEAREEALAAALRRGLRGGLRRRKFALDIREAAEHSEAQHGRLVDSVGGSVGTSGQRTNEGFDAVEDFEGKPEGRLTGGHVPEDAPAYVPRQPRPLDLGPSVGQRAMRCILSHHGGTMGDDEKQTVGTMSYEQLFEEARDALRYAPRAVLEAVVTLARFAARPGVRVMVDVVDEPAEVFCRETGDEEEICECSAHVRRRSSSAAAHRAVVDGLGPDMTTLLLRVVS